MKAVSAPEGATAALERPTAPWALDGVIDSVYFLMFDSLQQELESNRWHYARRWARHVPVTLVQPHQRLARRRDAWPAAAIDNCEVLPVVQAGDETTYPLRGLVQAGRVMEHMARRGHSRPLLWCYNPLLATLYAAVPAIARVYHASENYFDYEGLREFFQSGLETALRISDLVIPVSSGVADGIRSRVPEAHLEVVTNGCDIGHYQPTGSPSPEITAARDGFERVAVFAGQVNDRVDFELVGRAAEANASTLLVFVGPVSSLDGRDAETWRRVRGLQNVRHLERMGPEELAALYRSSDLGFIPYRREDRIVRNGFPLKTLEMAATGLPVVSSCMRPIVGLAAAIAVAEDDAQFLDSFATLSRSTITDQERHGLLEVAKANDYDRKFDQVVAGVAGSLPAGRGPHTRLDDLMVDLGYGPWAASCARIFSRFRAPLAFTFVHGRLGENLPDWALQLVPRRWKDRLRSHRVE
jgi:glycosyltransferase involved in cell wall biosynthesis